MMETPVTDGRHAEFIRRGVSLMKEGDKASTKGLFRRPDWDIASNKYEEAGNAFEKGQSYEQAVQAYVKASDAFTHAGDMSRLAGRALEAAATILARRLNRAREAATLYKRSSDCFDSDSRASEMLIKAGEVMEEEDVNAALHYYNDAIELYVQDNKAKLSMEVFKQAIAMLVRNKRYEEACKMYDRQEELLYDPKHHWQLYKVQLSHLLVQLKYDEQGARQRLKHLQNDERFWSSREGQACQQILQAYVQHDAEQLDAVVHGQVVSLLDNEVIKLARSLTVSDAEEHYESDDDDDDLR